LDECVAHTPATVLRHDIGMKALALAFAKEKAGNGCRTAAREARGRPDKLFIPNPAAM
jgi:hypothetical protein